MLDGVRIVVTGAAGMVGSRLSRRLLADGVLGSEAISDVLLVDAAAPAPIESGIPVETLVADLADESVAAQVASRCPAVIFHLAAVVSGEAEADPAKSYRTNVQASRGLLEAVARTPGAAPPRLVFSSSIAVFGPPFPEVIGDDEPPAPATTYGTHKAMIELLVDDYTRRGTVDGVSVRLPTICVRPGTPNRAASGFFSNIIREPLAGRAAILPVADDVRHWFASPRAAVGFLRHAATLPANALGRRRALTMPGVSATVAMEIEALRQAAGEETVALIKREPDETIARMVAGWPARFDPRRAASLGFRAEASIDELVRAHIDDELGGRFQPDV
jgi:D-erythronate 2-dehydrogenase